MKKLHYNGPIVLAIMDGVGLRVARSGNAVRQAHLEFLGHALTEYLNIPLAASGEAVGIMPGQMGNSEVGHNTIGSGQIVKQGVAQIEAAFLTGDIWQSKAWKGAMGWLGCKDGQTAKGTLHFAGIFSDGGVHSDIRHLEQMITEAYRMGVRRMRVHAVLDGRDTPPQSALKYVERFEKFCQKFPDADIRIASGGGRMVMTADRYENDWAMVKRGWDAMVRGKAPHEFKSVTEAIQALRKANPGIQDQYLPPFVIVENAAANSMLKARAIRAQSSTAASTRGAQPVGKIEDGDAVIYFDFRADRAVEIATAFTQPNFTAFDRGRVPKIYFAGMTEYNRDKHIPNNILVPPVKIEQPLNTFLGQQHVSQLAVSETVKFGHITYYFNGNSYKKAVGERHIEIPSDQGNYHQRPWMKSAEIADTVIDQLEKYQFVRLNFPGGDMVGHYAELESTIIALEAIDLQLKRIAERVDALGGMMIITADHGNAEELLDADGNPKTAHTVNPVPCIFYDNTKNRGTYRSADVKQPGLSNLAATVAILLGLNNYPESWQPPLITT